MRARPSSGNVVKGLVSVIIPVFNRPGLVREAADSALLQTYPHVEIILVDDGSTDGVTPRVCDELARCAPDQIRVLHTRNGGAGLAREAGLQVAAGEFIQYLDSDDRLLPGKLDLQVCALIASRDCGIAYGITRLIDGNGTVVESILKGTGTAHAQLFPRLLVERWWSTHTPLWRRSVCDAVGPWTGMRSCEDWEYDARAGALGTRLVFVPEPLSDTRRHGEGHLSAGYFDASKMRDITRLLCALYRCSLQSPTPSHAPSAEFFARWAFLSCRRAGAVGNTRDAMRCFLLARRAAQKNRRAARFLVPYRVAATVLGWDRLGRWTCASERKEISDYVDGPASQPTI